MITRSIITIAALALLPFGVSAGEIPAQMFAEKAAQSDMFEVEAAKLVVAEGVSEEVRNFAGDMVKDHQRSTSVLKEAAAKDGVKLPEDMGDDLRKKLESLKPLRGPALDAAYVSTQVSVHTEAVDLFEAYSKDGEAGALKSFAQMTFPTIRMHLIRVRNFNVEN